MPVLQKTTLYSWTTYELWVYLKVDNIEVSYFANYMKVTKKSYCLSWQKTSYAN